MNNRGLKSKMTIYLRVHARYSSDLQRLDWWGSKILTPAMNVGRLALLTKTMTGFVPGIKYAPGQWWRSLTIYRGKRSTSQIMMTSSNGSIFRVTGPLCGEFTGPGEFPTQRPVTRSFDVFFDLRLNKRLSKQPWGWWSETPSSSLWRHRNDVHGFVWLCFVVHHRPS